jgi:hypothetical protein
MNELKLRRYEKLPLSNFSSLSIFKFGLNLNRSENSVADFLSSNLDLVAFCLNGVVVEKRGSRKVFSSPGGMLRNDYEPASRNLLTFADVVWPIIEREAQSRKQLAEARKLKRQADDALNTASKHREKTGQVLITAQKAAKGAKKVAGNVGIAAEAKHFALEAESHEKNALRWLVAAVIGAVIISLVGIYFYFCDKPTATTSLKMIDWNNFLPKLSSLAILLYFEYSIISIYRSERHNQLTNLQRANALKTFEAMTSSTEAQHITDAITLTAAGAIYAPQDTGFSRRTTSQQMSAADILGSMTNRNSD